MNKFTKGKTIGIVAAGLAIVSLVGVGFSAWVINGNTTNMAADGNVTVTVADVSDERITISNLKLNSNSGIKFDAASDDTTGPIVSSNGTEQLSFCVTFTLDLAQAASKFSNIQAYMSLADNTDSSKKTSFESAVNTKNYIVTPVKYESTHSTASSNGTALIPSGKSLTNDVTTSTDTTLTDNSNKAFETKCKKNNENKYEFSVTFNFQWGSAFGGMNPSHVGEPSYPTNATVKTADEAITALKEMKSFDNIQFNVYLSVITASN